MSSEAIKAHMEVHPSVLYKLGDELITDDIQALAELIKNAYDADATYAIIRVVTDQGPEEYPSDRGYVTIIDNGRGMTVDEIRNGWLTVSNSLKKRMKETQATTQSGRTPLGDKGLGRLGAQRLGHRLSIHTTPSNRQATYYVSFDWRDFRQYDQLSQYELSILASSPEADSGTSITVSDLRDASNLAAEDRLREALARIISPYRGVSGFEIHASVNGKSIDLQLLEDDLRRAAVIHYDLFYDTDDQLHVEGRMRLNHLRPPSKDDRLIFDDICQADEGRALLAFLQEKPIGVDMKLGPATHPGWWAQFVFRTSLEEVKPIDVGGGPGQLERNVSSRLPRDRSETGSEGADSCFASPGPFLGEIDAYNLTPASFDEFSGYAALSVLRSHVKSLAGIRIYRDGFNIPTDSDWLQLGQSWTAGRSWYGLRPATTLGYIELTARENPFLIETTDRERFSETPHYLNFMKILNQFISFTHKAHQFIGRSAVEFRKIAIAKGQRTAAATPREMTTRLSETLQSAKDYRLAAASINESLSEGLEVADDIARRLASNESPLELASIELAKRVNILQSCAESAMIGADRIASFISDLEEQSAVALRLQHELEALEEQLLLSYETMGVGLIAESLAHEISNIVDRLTARTNSIRKRVGEKYSQDRVISRYIGEVRTSTHGLRMQVAHLAPYLRYVRDARETFSVSSVLDDTRTYFLSRWSGESLTIQIDIVKDIQLNMNRGRLLQVLDNLLLNAEYWLREALRTGKVEIGVIKLLCEEDKVTVEDNGLGVSHDIENSLFEPFTTRKPQGTGRGLGLYIATQLLEAAGCSIRLMHDRNVHDRRFRFQLDLTAVVER